MKISDQTHCIEAVTTVYLRPFTHGQSVLPAIALALILCCNALKHTRTQSRSQPFTECAGRSMWLDPKLIPADIPYPRGITLAFKTDPLQIFKISIHQQHVRVDICSPVFRPARDQGMLTPDDLGRPPSIIHPLGQRVNLSRHRWKPPILQCYYLHLTT